MQGQLDIFDDSRDVALRNDLAQALRDGHAGAAQQVADTLAAEFGGDPVLAPAAILIGHLQRQRSLDASDRLDAATVLELRRHLDGPVTAAAPAVMGASEAAAWLAGQWCWLAHRARDIGWHRDHADAHAAALFLRGQAWQQAADAVASIEAWRRIPVPLLWMAQARWCGTGADAAWPLLAEALWLAPARARALLPSLHDPELGRLTERFEERLDPPADGTADHWSWLPAFALVERPLLADPLSAATPPVGHAAGEAFRVVMALLRLERQARHREIVVQRARLRELSAPLFAAYMSTR